MEKINYVSLVDLLEKKAEQHPDFTLYTFFHSNTTENNATLSIGDLAEQAKKIAIILQKVTKPGDRVIIIYTPGLELISAFFGCLYAGVIAVPVYPPATKELVGKLQHIIKNCGATLVLTTKEIHKQIKKLRLVKWCGRNQFMQKIATQFIGPSFTRVLQLSDWNFEKMRFVTSDDLPTQLDLWHHPDVNEDHLAFLQYTSGSTGAPKGVMIGHGNLLHNLNAIQKINNLTEEDITVSWLPPYHDMGLIGGILIGLYATVNVKLLSPRTFLQRPSIWLEIISQFKATGTVAPNFAYDLCIQKITEDEKQQLDLSSLRILMNGAEPIRSKTMENFIEYFAPCGLRPNVFLPCYGLAESTLIVAGVECEKGAETRYVDRSALNDNKIVYCDPTHSQVHRLINCGRPVHGAEIAIVNTETLQECSNREIGEIWVSSKSVAKGYWQLPEETKHSFYAQLEHDKRFFLRTGDLGFLDDGSLFVTGRMKDVIIIRGRNYYPHDLEHTLYDCHTDLRNNCCAIFSIDQDEKELLVVVHEVKDTSKSLDSESIIYSITSSILKTHGISVDIVALTGRKSVPKTTSGKIQRMLCKKNYLAGELNIIEMEQSLGEKTNKNSEQLNKHEKTLPKHMSDSMQFLAPILNADISLADCEKKLSELGLTSIKLVELQYALSNITQSDVSMEFLLGDPSLKEIVDFLEGKIDLNQLSMKNQVDLAKEFNKYQSLTVDITSQLNPTPKNALVTGATGFLSAYLLSELLNHTDWQICCLVQASSATEGKTRIIKNLEHYDLWQPVYSERIQVVLGNLAKPKLGVTEQEWEHLAECIDLIFHSAAVLNFIYPYQKMMGVNVLGTKHMLELAGYKHLKGFHYVSTIGYFMSADLEDSVVINEQTELDLTAGIYGGYNQTKWLAERLVLNARHHNIPTVIYRPSLITGASNTGYWNQADVVCRMLKGCIDTGIIPKLDIQLNFVPVDYVAKSIALLAKQAPYQEDTLHLINPFDLSFEQLRDRIRAKGFKINEVSYEEWQKMIKDNIGYYTDSSFSPLRPFLTEKVPAKNVSLFDLYIHNNKAKIDCSYTQEKLALLNVSCDTPDEVLLDKYLDYLIACGYLTHHTDKVMV